MLCGREGEAVSLILSTVRICTKLRLMCGYRGNVRMYGWKVRLRRQLSVCKQCFMKPSPCTCRCFCVGSDFNHVLSANYNVLDTPSYCCSALLPSGKEADCLLTVVAFSEGNGLCKIALVSVCIASR